MVIPVLFKISFTLLYLFKLKKEIFRNFENFS